MQGILLRLAAVALMTAMLSVIHHAAKTLPVGQIMVWRSAIAGVVILGFAWRFGGLRQVIPRKPRDHAVRGLLGALTMVFSFTSLAYLPVDWLSRHWRCSNRDRSPDHLGGPQL